jgi:hypothetical protein
MTEFSLRALVRQVWDELGGCDYHVLADKLLPRIEEGNRQAALDEALVAYCRQFTVGLHATLRKAPARARQDSARSWKVAGVRKSWPELRAHIFTKDGQKALGKCTFEDLIFHADLLERQARQLQSKSARVRDLAALLRAHQVARVENLPAEVLAEYFESEAA